MEKSQREIRFECSQRQERPHRAGVQKFHDHLRRLQRPERIYERNVGFSLR